MLQNLLAYPELENPVNLEAASIFSTAPHLYEQLARDSVIASKRLESGMPIFDENISEPITEDVLNPQIKSQLKISRLKNLVPFDIYHLDWKNLATSIAFVNTKINNTKRISNSNEGVVLVQLQKSDCKMPTNYNETFMNRNHLTPNQAKSLINR
jgi:hypothetical protein